MSEKWAAPRPLVSLNCLFFRRKPPYHLIHSCLYPIDCECPLVSHSLMSQHVALQHMPLYHIPLGPMIFIVYDSHIYIYKYPIIPLCPSISHYVIIFLAVPPLYLHSAWRAWGAHQFPLIESIHRDKLQEELTNLNCSACWDTCGNFSPSFQ